MFSSQVIEFIRSRHTFVPPTGPVSCKLALIAEQPGKSEIFSTPPKPLIGPAGKELDKCFSVVKIVRPEVYLTNTIKDLDHPLQHYIDLSGKSPVVSTEGQMYIDLLKEELSECSADVLVAMGNIAMFALTGRVGITKWRGSILESTLLPGRKVIPIIHTSTLISRRDRPSQYMNRYLVINDLDRANRVSTIPDFTFRSRKLIIEPSYYDVLTQLSTLKMSGLSGKRISFDIEITNFEVSCISFTDNLSWAISIPFIFGSGDYFTPEQEVEIWKLIAEILEHPEIKKCGQNLVFDGHFLLNKYGIHLTNFDDTMVSFNTIFPEFRKSKKYQALSSGLHFINSLYIDDIPYYKEDGKFWLKGIGSWERGWQYNCLDSVSCAELMPKLEEDLIKQGNTEHYLRQVKVVEPCIFMQEHGVRIDIEGMKNAITEYEKDLLTYETELCQLAGFSLNANSNQQLCEYFYTKAGRKPYTKKRADGSSSDSVDTNALKRLIRQGIKEATLVRDIRKIKKKLSTYTDLDKVDSDNRLRCSYNPVGTKFTRLSSSKNIFGTGMNQQNWPHELLKFQLYDEGYLGYEVDLSMAELRIMAYVGNITQMISAIEEGLDIHTLTASFIANKPYEEISNIDGSSELGNGEQSERYWGKKSNFELGYDMGYKSFSLMCELPETEGKFIHNRYHTLYPGVKQNYHKLIQTMLSKNRTITNLFGRKTKLLDEWGDKLFKVGYACIPQGSVGDIINEWGINFIYYNHQWFKHVEILKQIHDAINFQIPVSLPWIEHAEIIQRIKNSLEQPLHWEDRTFNIPADFVIGLNMRKEEGVKLDCNKCSNLNELANKIEDAYKHLYLLKQE
jgi:uracil-DNA glycosylase family 4